MVSATVIVIILVVVVLIIGIALFLLVRSNSNKGTTGSTGSTGNVCSTCTTVPNACVSANVLKIGYTGVNCSSSCKQSSSITPVSGCVAPACGSAFCTPQAALYTNLSSTGTLYNFCNTGVSTAYPPNSCNVSLTAQQLGSLTIPASSVTNAILNPVFITTPYLSIYQTTQPIAEGSIPQESIQINLTDPTVINNPYILYNSNGIVSFQRVQDILTLGDINNAIWAYNTDVNRLVLFSNINQNYSLNSTILQSTTFELYDGVNPPCGIMEYVSPAVGTNVYDPNSGLFSTTQTNSIIGTSSGQFVITVDTNGNNLATSTIQNVQYTLCTNTNRARWYGISAINTFLGQ